MGLSGIADLTASRICLSHFGGKFSGSDKSVKDFRPPSFLKRIACHWCSRFSHRDTYGILERFSCIPCPLSFGESPIVMCIFSRDPWCRIWQLFRPAHCQQAACGVLFWPVPLLP